MEHSYIASCLRNGGGGGDVEAERRPKGVMGQGLL
jgi:hypothetical protein